MTGPPVDFDHYLNWTEQRAEGRAWWREQVSKDHDLYACHNCGDRVWLMKGEGMPEELPCRSLTGGVPCGGVLKRQKPKQFWEQHDA